MNCNILLKAGPPTGVPQYLCRLRAPRSLITSIDVNLSFATQDRNQTSE
jgi:hypothetical protein